MFILYSCDDDAYAVHIYRVVIITTCPPTSISGDKTSYVYNTISSNRSQSYADSFFVYNIILYNNIEENVCYFSFIQNISFNFSIVSVHCCSCPDFRKLGDCTWYYT